MVKLLSTSARVLGPAHFDYCRFTIRHDVLNFCSGPLSNPFPRLFPVIRLSASITLSLDLSHLLSLDGSASEDAISNNNSSRPCGNNLQPHHGRVTVFHRWRSRRMLGELVVLMYYINNATRSHRSFCFYPILKNERKKTYQLKKTYHGDVKAWREITTDAIGRCSSGIGN